MNLEENALAAFQLGRDVRLIEQFFASTPFQRERPDDCQSKVSALPAVRRVLEGEISLVEDARKSLVQHIGQLSREAGISPAEIFARAQRVREQALPFSSAPILGMGTEIEWSEAVMPLEGGTSRLARLLYNELRLFPGLGQLVVDDGCYERTEAMLAVLRVHYGVPEQMLGRAFVMNPFAGQFLWAEKPLSRNGRQLESWFASAMENSQLNPGASFETEGLRYTVDDYRALRSELLPTIYFDQRATAYWGVGHAAPMVGPYVIDPSFGRGILSFEEWRDALHLPGLIPLLGSAHQCPEIAPHYFDQQAQDVSGGVLKTLGIWQGTNTEEINPLLCAMSEAQKMEFFDALFAYQLREGGVLPRRNWSALFPGVLTTRGEKYGSPNLDLRGRIEDDLHADWLLRYQTSLEALRPFDGFQRLILGAPYRWTPSSVCST